MISRQNNSTSDLTKELDKDGSCFKKLRAKHPMNILFGHLNINSLRNRLEYLEKIIKNMFDVFLILEFKLDLSFPDTQFQIANHMFQKDQSKNGGRLFHVNQDLNCKIVDTYNFPTDIEILPLELALTKRKWLILGLYKTPSLRSETFISEVTKALTLYSEKCENILLMGDLNITPENHHLKDFTDSNGFVNLIKDPACFKSTSPTTIDLCFMKFSTDETGISDHHKLIYIFLNSSYAKGKSKFVSYRCFKNFNKELFQKNLSENLKNIGNSFEVFYDTFTNTLDCFASLKKKSCCSHNHFMTKKLRTEVMTRSLFRTKYNRNRTYENWLNYKMQRNICTNIVKKRKTDYFNNIDIKNITDNKRFWTAVKFFFTDKSKTCNKIILNVNDKTIKDGKEIANKFNKYFVSIIKKPNLKKDTGTSFESQASCRMIKMKFGKENFSFEVFTDTVANIIKNLPTGTASVSNHVPVTIDTYSPKLTQIMIDCLRNNFFPDILKNAEITLCFKKGEKGEKENYRPVSILSNFSKVFERLIYNELNEFLETKLSKFLNGF